MSFFTCIEILPPDNSRLSCIRVNMIQYVLCTLHTVHFKPDAQKFTRIDENKINGTTKQKIVCFVIILCWLGFFILVFLSVFFFIVAFVYLFTSQLLYSSHCYYWRGRYLLLLLLVKMLFANILWHVIAHLYANAFAKYFIEQNISLGKNEFSTKWTKKTKIVHTLFPIGYDCITHDFLCLYVIALRMVW